MDKKTTGIVAYLTVIGFIVALVIGDKEGAKFHLNQSLVLQILVLANIIISKIPIVGWIISCAISLFLLICWIIGFVGAINGEEKEMPLLGSIKIL